MTRFDSCRVVQARLAVPAGADTRVNFAQLTVEFVSQQRFAAFDARGRLLAGDAARAVSVVEHWVFERSMVAEMHNKAWRTAGRLQVGGGSAAAGAQRAPP